MLFGTSLQANLNSLHLIFTSCQLFETLFIIHLVQELNEQFEFISPEINRNVKHDRLIPNFGTKY